MRCAAVSSDVATALESRGKEAPISVVGSNSPAKHKAKIAVGLSITPAKSVAKKSYKKNFETSAKEATAVSATANPISAPRGESRSESHAPRMEPTPRPARKAPTTSAAETVSDPANTPSMRCQIIWHKSAANPETKNARVNLAMGTVGGTDSLKSAGVTKSSEQLMFAFNQNFLLVNIVDDFKSEVQH